MRVYKQFEDLIVFLAVESWRQAALQQQEPQSSVYLLLNVACPGKKKKIHTVLLQFYCIHPSFLLCGTSSALWLLLDGGRESGLLFWHSCVNAERLLQPFKTQLNEMVILAKGRLFKTQPNLGQ